MIIYIYCVILIIYIWIMSYIFIFICNYIYYGSLVGAGIPLDLPLTPQKSLRAAKELHIRSTSISARFTVGDESKLRISGSGNTHQMSISIY